jgi:hypothetical protein
MLPAVVRSVLMSDRFSGSPELTTWCRGSGLGLGLRLKQDLLAASASIPQPARTPA